MLTPDTAAVLITAIARELEVTGASVGPESTNALHALAHHSKWLGEVAEAELNRRLIAAQLQDQKVIAARGVERERPLARQRVVALDKSLAAAETEIHRLMERRPVA